MSVKNHPRFRDRFLERAWRLAELPLRWLVYLVGVFIGFLLLRPKGWYVLFGTWPGRLGLAAVITAFAIFVFIVSRKDKRELAAHLKQLDARKAAYRDRKTEQQAQRGAGRNGLMQ
jgi:hypothetical protein